MDAAALAILLAAVAAIATVAALAHPIGDHFTESDLFEYVTGARAIAQGRIDASRYGVVGPVYELLLAPGVAFDRDLFGWARALSVAAAAVTLGCCWAAARARLGSTAALWTVAFVAVNPVFFRYAYSSTTDLLAMALQGAAWLAFLTSRGRGFAWAGALTALAVLTRYTAIYLLPLGLAASVASAERRTRGVSYLAGLGMVLVPWLGFSLAHGVVPGQRLLQNYDFYAPSSSGNVQDEPYDPNAPNASLPPEPARDRGRFANPIETVARVAATLPRHFRADAAELLGWPTAILAAAGFALGLADGRWRAVLPFLAGAGTLFVLLGAAFYSDRYSLPLVPLLATGAGAALTSRFVTRLRLGPIPVVGLVALVALGLSIRSSVALQTFVHRQLPIDVLPAARVLRSHGGGAAVMARKAGIAHYGGARSVPFPRVDDWQSLGAFARENGASHLYYSWCEGQLRPEFWCLLDSTAAIPGLTAVESHAHPPGILYRIDPRFGEAPEWWTDEARREIHTSRGHVRVVPDSQAFALHQWLGIAAAREGRFGAALDHFRAMTRGRPRDEEGWLLRAHAALSAESLAAARTCFHTACDLAPGDARATLGYGEALWRSGLVAEAAVSLEPVLDGVRDPEMLGALAAEYRRQGRPESARRAEIAQAAVVKP